MTTQFLTIAQALAQASSYHQAGYLKEAERLYRAILQANPDEPEANHNLGALLCAVGDYAQAEPLLRRAIRVAPMAARYWLSCQDALLKWGKLEQARALTAEASSRALPTATVYQLQARLQQFSEQQRPDRSRPKQQLRSSQPAGQKETEAGPVAPIAWADRPALEQLRTHFQAREFDTVVEIARQLIERFPDDGRLWKFLSGALFNLGRKEELVEAARRTSQLLGEDAENHNNLAAALKDVQRFEEADISSRRALEINPDYPEALANRASILIELHRYAEAEECARRAVRLKPALAAGHNKLWRALVLLGTAASALAPLKTAIELAPTLADAHCNLGHAYLALGKNHEAVAAYVRAVELRPTLVDAQLGLGDALLVSWRFELAEKHFRAAVEAAPATGMKPVRASLGLGRSLFSQGLVDEAVPHLERAIDYGLLAPESVLGSRLLLPAVPRSIDEIELWRGRFIRGIEEFAASGARTNYPLSITPNTFYLAYHDRCDRAIMESLGHAIRDSAPALEYPKPFKWVSPRLQTRKIRVGVLSALLHAHTIGKLFAGMIFNLDRERFELIVIRAADSKQDVTSRGIDAMASKVVDLSLKDLRGQQDAIANERLDVLLYPDIGMTYTYFLAFARFAPVQVVSWGHPDTTGLDSVDYFLSAESIEPADADSHYTERLVRLHRLPCFYLPFFAPSVIPERTFLGLPAQGNLYGCPQSTFKLHPDFDAILQQIVEGDPDGYIVMLEGLADPWKHILLDRWAHSAPLLLERVIFLQQRPLEGFMALMAHFDVVLDPIHFGSGNTLYEAMVYGTPIVTWPGRFMRGRIVAGAYEQMRIADAPVARRLEDYAPLAVSLGTNPEKRNALRRQLLEAAGRELFADLRAIREIEEFLEAAVDAAAAGTKLSPDWRPSLTPGIASRA